ncbi:MAG: transglutaminase family protein [Actinomycetota bacterium]
MLFEISHLTRFVYDAPVILEPLTVRLRPRSDLFQRLISFDLAANPAPEGSSDLMDAEGNAATQLWFLGSWSMLSLRATSVVETLSPNPFAYVVLDTQALRMPPVYPDSARRALTPYLEPPPGGGDPAVAAFAAAAVEAAGGGATAFLVGLCTRIAATIGSEIRPSGDPRPGGETLALGRGACRDQAVLFIEACRCAGLAARFVTGYELSAAAGRSGHANEHELHAWAEVYLEGAGWRGYDPSQGLAVADRHVVVATGADPLGAAPTSGTYRGSDVGSSLETTIRVRVGPNDALRHHVHA